MGRPPEHPAVTLMMRPDGRIVPVPQVIEAARARRGWTMVARESEILPFNPPRLIFDDSPYQNWPNRESD